MHAMRRAMISAALVPFMLVAQCAPPAPLPPTGVGSCHPYTSGVTAMQWCSAAEENSFHQFRAEATFVVYSTYVAIAPFEVTELGPLKNPEDCCPSVPEATAIESHAPLPDLTYVEGYGYNAFYLKTNHLGLYP